MIKLVQAFNHRFRHWRISLPKADVRLRKAGAICTAGWTIRNNFRIEGGRECIEFFSSHRMTNDTLTRIYEDGTVLLVGACQEVYDPAAPNGETDLQMNNREFYRKVRELGLG